MLTHPVTSVIVSCVLEAVFVAVEPAGNRINKAESKASVPKRGAEDVQLGSTWWGLGFRMKNLSAQFLNQGYNVDDKNMIFL